MLDRIGPAALDRLVAGLAGPLAGVVDVGLRIELRIRLLDQRHPGLARQAVLDIAAQRHPVGPGDRHILVHRHINRRAIEVKTHAIRPVGVVDHRVGDHRPVHPGNRPQAGHQIAGAGAALVDVAGRGTAHKQRAGHLGIAVDPGRRLAVRGIAANHRHRQVAPQEPLVDQPAGLLRRQPGRHVTQRRHIADRLGAAPELRVAGIAHNHAGADRADIIAAVQQREIGVHRLKVGKFDGGNPVPRRRFEQPQHLQVGDGIVRTRRRRQRTDLCVTQACRPAHANLLSSHQ